MKKTKICSVCKIKKSITKFWKRRSAYDGLCSDCKICSYQRNQKYLKDNPNIRKTISKRYRNKHLIEHRKRAIVWCKNNPEKRKIIVARFRKKHPEKRKEYSIRRLCELYGINIKEYEQMKINQHNKCAICGNDFMNIKDCHLDHDHKTGKIRELLCRNCNLGIGIFKENITICKKAILYLKKWKKASGKI